MAAGRVFQSALESDFISGESSKSSRFDFLPFTRVPLSTACIHTVYISDRCMALTVCSVEVQEIGHATGLRKGKT